MARLLLLCLVAADLFQVLAMARPFPEVIRRHDSELKRIIVADPPSSYVHLDLLNSGLAGAPSYLHHEKHVSSHKSIIGGEVILGGFAAAAVFAVIAYIRITRRMSAEETKS